MAKRTLVERAGMRDCVDSVGICVCALVFCVEPALRSEMDLLDNGAGSMHIGSDVICATGAGIVGRLDKAE